MMNAPRLQQLWKKVRETWSPIAGEILRRMAKFGSRNTDQTAGCALGCLGLLAIGAAMIWAGGRSYRSSRATPPPVVMATPPASRMAHPVPRESPTPPLDVSSPAPVFGRITTEKEGRLKALRLYPALGVPNTPLNIEFVTRYNLYRIEKPEFFGDPAWPVILVKECAAALGEIPAP
jgi:hypothetical protein